MDLPANYPFKCSPVLPARDPPFSLTTARCPCFISFDHHLLYVTIHNIPRVDTCVLHLYTFKTPVRDHFMNSQVKEKNSLASVISVIIPHKVNAHIYTAFAQEEDQQWQVLLIGSCSFWDKHYNIYEHKGLRDGFCTPGMCLFSSKIWSETSHNSFMSDAVHFERCSNITRFLTPTNPWANTIITNIH